MRKTKIFLSVILSLFLVTGFAKQINPPQAIWCPDSVLACGHWLRDDLSYLRDRNSPLTKQYLKQENAYADMMLKKSRPYADTVYKEFVGRLVEKEISQPYLDHGYYYYTREEKGKPYSVHCRRKAEFLAQGRTKSGSPSIKYSERNKSDNSIQIGNKGEWAAAGSGTTLNWQYFTEDKTTPFSQFKEIFLGKQKTKAKQEAAQYFKEQIILDENKLGAGEPFFALGTFCISPDQNWLAYTTDESGNELYRLYIKNLATGKIYKTDFTSISEAVWMADSQTLLLTSENERMQCDTALRYNFKTGTKEILFRETDPEWDLSVYYNRDSEMIWLSSSSKDASEMWFLHPNDYGGHFTCLMPRQEKHYYYAEYYEGHFYVCTNLYQADYDLACVAEDSVKTGHWNILYQGTQKQPIQSFLVFKKYIVLLQRINGFDALVIADRLTGKSTAIFAPPNPMDISFWVNLDPEADFFYFTMENEVTPLTLYVHNFTTGKKEIIRSFPPAGKFEQGKYISRLDWVKTEDGTLVPLILTYKKDLDLTKPHIVKLSGYGAYGDCNDPYFSSSALSFLDRDYILATAHIRGGGEFGQNWYDGGRLLNKKNTFTDFIACMDYLLQKGITTKEQLIIEGGSAGGLLMGAVLNQAWDKCALVIADVPFVDLMQTMLDPALPLTLQEYEEWGNPNDPQFFNYMLSYSPIDNVKPHPYPAVFITTAWNDTRVGYWEAVKWAAKLRANNTGKNPILLKVNKNEGHTGQADRYKFLKSYAEEVGYILYYMESKQKSAL